MPKSEEDYLPPNVKKQGEVAIEAQKKAAGQEPEPTKPTEEPATPEPAQPTNPEPAPVEPAKNDPPKGDDDLNHKYSVLQGMYNKDTNELKIALDQTKEQNKNLQAMLDKMNQTIANIGNSPAQPAPEPPKPVAVLKVEDFSSYGSEMEDLVNLFNELVNRVATLEKAPRNAGMDPELVQRINRIEGHQVKTAKDRFYDAMDQALPDWGTKNHDDGFKKWLNEIDPVSNIQRSIMLKHAFEQWNANQVVAIFNAYFGAPTANPAPANPQSSLAAQVTPESTGNADGGSGGKPPTQYATKEQLLKAQDDFVKGRITEADFDKISNSFQAGVAAGSNQP